MSARVLWVLLVLVVTTAGCNAILDNKLFDLAESGANSTAGSDATVDGAERPDPRDATSEDATFDVRQVDAGGDGADGADGGCGSPSDVHACGSCGNDCAQLSNVAAAGLACMAGHCAYRCASGYADCGDAGSGCGTSLNSPGNCGGCGVTCITPTPLCARGDAGTFACASACAAAETNCGGTCANVASDRSHCGSCGNACPAGQDCAAGACLCAAAASPDFCGGACTSLRADSTNCGSCGHACTGGQTCQAGVCACPTGQTLCGGACVDASRDSMHCGASCTACTGGATCQAGACSCPAGTTLCAGSCVNVLGTDVANCGGCGNGCAQLLHVSGTGLACKAGVCSYQCATGFADCADAGAGCGTSLGTTTNCGGCGVSCGASTPTCEAVDGGASVCATGCVAGEANCSGTCTTLSSDSNNCGVCGKACPPTQGCVGGTCGCSIAGQKLCGTVCTNTQNDNANCGACGNACPPSATCQAGICACPPGTPQLALCGTACVDTRQDNANCGTCGSKCASPLSCQSGTCACPPASPPQSLCSGVCTNTLQDGANCGSCGHACASGQQCVSGGCQCNATSCPNGCCNGTGQCVLMPSSTACGLGGAACQACTPGIACTSGICLGCGAPTTLSAGSVAADSFGNAVAASGTTIAVGANGAGSGTGTAWLFSPSGTNNGLLVPTAGAPSGASYGSSLGVSGGTAVVGGAPGGVPTVWGFNQTGLNWFPSSTPSFAPALTGLTSAPTVVLDGSTAVAGGIFDAAVYVESGGTWSLQATLTPSDFTPSSAVGYFGRPLAISGDTIVVTGEPFDTSGQLAHWGYVYVRSGTTWTQQAKLVPSNLASNASPHFYFTVAISGDTIAMATSAGIYVFVRSASTWTQQAGSPFATTTASMGGGFGAGVAMKSNAILVGSPSFSGGLGMAFLFGLAANGTWVQAPTLATNLVGDGFGTAVALSGTTAVVSAPGTTGNAFAYTCFP